jgi:hypothetical protein
MTYRILCRVTGGVTGTREAYLRRGDKLVTFDNLPAAELEAQRLTLKQNARPAGRAQFSYTVDAYA